MGRAPPKNLTTAALFSFMLLGLHLIPSLSEASVLHDCCHRYSTKVLPRHLVRDFTIQSSAEVCEIDAIIFHTRRQFNICANPEDPWVQEIITSLREKRIRTPLVKKRS